MPPGMASAVQDILSTYKPEVNTGDPTIDFTRFMNSQDPAKLEALVNTMESFSTSGPNLETFDFNRIPVKKESFWVLQMTHSAFQGADGKTSERYFEGSQPVFQIIIYDENASFRVCDNVPKPGLPSSDFFLKLFILLLYLMLTSTDLVEITPHISSLKPFFDSLPPPFSWRLETREEAQDVADGVDRRNKAGVAKGLRDADKAKALGNQAISQKNRKNAVKYYTDAINSLTDALAQMPTEEEEREGKAMLSICLANRAAAHLMDGEGQSPKEALNDGKLSVKLNESYAKAYYRQAKALELLGNIEESINVLADALSKPQLAEDSGLNDTLIELYGGVPDEERDLRQFCLKVFGKDESAKVQRPRRVQEENQYPDTKSHRV
ncbi:hypothetical protein C8Q75DRAFT_803434 [Abortiporus biennis]|nr:hypothetical protein C8Q75DRAFT_803434 [Abortiporus biennis]